MSGPQSAHAPLAATLVAIIIAAGLPLVAAAVIAVIARLIAPEAQPTWTGDLNAAAVCEVSR